MKQKLEELTMSQFIDLLCGDTSVLKKPHEIVSPTKLATAVRNIIFEYKEISDKAGARSYLASIEDYVKAKITSVIMTMCKYLVDVGRHDTARNILAEMGVKAAAMTDKRLEAEIKSRLERAKHEIEKAENESTPDKVDKAALRCSFDEQTASMMAYFKFQIDPAVMKATVFAHLVARQNREMKAQAAALRKK